MPVGAASWSFTEDDYSAIMRSLQRFLEESNARSALLVDRSGQLVATAGDSPHFDPISAPTISWRVSSVRPSSALSSIRASRSRCISWTSCGA
jgi:hypothetical protein